MGGPRWDDPNAKVRPEQGLLGIRKALGLFANLRPVTVYPQLVGASPLRPEILAGVDLMVVRELTGGIYFGEKTRHRLDSGGEKASDLCTYTTGEVERVVRAAARLARGRRGKLTSVDKANVLETSRLWRSVATQIRDVLVSVVEDDHGPRALPAVEIVTDGPYDYDARYNPGRTEYFAPARLTETEATAVTNAAVEAHRALGLRHLSRTDLILDESFIMPIGSTLAAHSGPGTLVVGMHEWET